MHLRSSLVALAAAASIAPVSARAAEVTDVASAMDERHALEVDLGATYRHLRKDTKITRENLQADAAGNKGIVLVDELLHTQTTDEMVFRLAVGLWHDLELHAFAPLSLRDQQAWDFATLNGASVGPTSTLANNKLDVSGCLKPGSCQAVAPILNLPGKSVRTGFRDPTIGIAWSPINEGRELRLHPELFPPGHPVATWVLGFDYTLPLPGDVDDPSKFGAAAGMGAVGLPSRGSLRKAHVFTLWTAFSKRFRVADPYIVIRASAPVAVKSGAIGEGAYDNCWHPELLADVAAVNCADPAWKNQAQYSPPYEGLFAVGTELVFYENQQAAQKFAVDLRGEAHYTSPQRGYTQAADALGKLTYADEFITGTASIGLYARAASWLHARVVAQAGMDTPHFITTEPIGKDLNGDGRITLSNGTKGSLEQSPTYDFRLDQVGRRLRAETTVIWGLSGSLQLVF